MNKRPYTDLKDLVDAATDQAVDERVVPVIEKLNRATDRLEDIHPLLENVVKRQNGHLVWLSLLTAAVTIIGLVLIDHV